MSTTLIKEILGVKRFLGDPLDQSPSVKQIIDELEAEYQNVTNEVNNRGNAQIIAEVLLTTVAGQRQYDLTLPNSFYKALSLSTVPEEATTSVTPDGNQVEIAVNSGSGEQQRLELTELENLTDDWGWLRSNSGQLMTSNHDSQVAAIYRVLTTEAGETIRIEMRPTPSEAQKYLLLYQVTDWWEKTVLNVSNSGTTRLADFQFPFSSQRMYIRACTAFNLLTEGVVKWSLDNAYNKGRARILAGGLEKRIARYKNAYDSYIDGLDQGDVTYIELWGDRAGL